MDGRLIGEILLNVTYSRVVSLYLPTYNVVLFYESAVVVAVHYEEKAVQTVQRISLILRSILVSGTWKSERGGEGGGGHKSRNLVNNFPQESCYKLSCYRTKKDLVVLGSSIVKER